MKPRYALITLLSTLTVWGCLANHAKAQIGPDLRPPGLSPTHPLHSYSENGNGEDDYWSNLSSWDLDTSDVVFSAAKKKQLISEAPSTIHVITHRDIARHGWRSLPEILRHVPGVQTQKTHSQFSSVMIRGLVGTENNNSRILWLQNGVPMNDVRDSGIWIDETYPVELIKRIEIVLGPGSALYGSGAFQGVINIFTKDPADVHPYGEYQLTIQNNLTFKASAIAAYTNESKTFGFLGHVSANTTQGPGLIGDYVYQDYLMSQAGASMSAGAQPTQFRYSHINSNSDKHWYNINLKLIAKQFKWNVGFTDIYAGADGSEIVPNVFYSLPSASDTPTAPDTVIDEDVPQKDKAAYRFNRREFFTDLFYEDNFTENLSFLALLSYRMIQYNHKHYGGYSGNDEFHIPVLNPDGYSNKWDSTHFENKVNYETIQHKLYGLAQVQWHIYHSNELIAGAVLEYHHINTPEFSNGSSLLFEDNSQIIGIKSPTVNAQSLGYLTPSIFIQDEQRFWDDRIILTAGGRFDAYKATDNVDPAPSWRFAFLAKWTPWMTMRMSYGYAFKEPSLYQLYVDTFDVVGDTSLKPETLHNVELSFLFTPVANTKIRLDGFATFMHNLIIMRTSPYQGDSFYGTDNRYIPAQDSDAKLYGFELSADSTINHSWSIYGHYNFLYSNREFHVDKNTYELNKNYYDHKSIPDDAMHRLKFGFSYFDQLITADLAIFAVLGTPRTISSFAWREDYSTPSYAVLQPQISIALPANFGISLSSSFAFSKDMGKAPSWHYYYEKEGVPSDRYSVSLTLNYPYRY